MIPLDHLLRVTAEEPQSRWTDLRAPGTHLPGVIKARTYYPRHGREFWYATVDRKFLVLELREGLYHKIVQNQAERDRRTKNRDFGSFSPVHRPHEGKHHSSHHARHSGYGHFDKSLY